MLGCAQQAISDGDQRDMPIYRVKVPDLILIESISFALFVRDFNGPAVASDTGDPLGLPVQFIRLYQGLWCSISHRQLIAEGRCLCQATRKSPSVLGVYAP